MVGLEVQGRIRSLVSVLLLLVSRKPGLVASLTLCPNNLCLTVALIWILFLTCFPFLLVVDSVIVFLLGIQTGDWIKGALFCVSIDLKDAFLHVPMSKRFHKYLKFEWQGVLYCWSVLPFGLRCSFRVLTKVLKPVSFLLMSMSSFMF